jgi:hypothetical protein
MNEINQTSASFGSVTMDVTNYNITTSGTSATASSSMTDSGCGMNYSTETNSTVSGVVQFGQLPVTNTVLLTMLDFSSSSPSVGTSSGIFQLVSLTLNPGYASTSSSSTTAKSSTTYTTV